MNQNNRPYIIVVTGGIASGKSEASKFLRSIGYTVLDCDFIVHEGYRKKGDLYLSLINEFGNEILDEFNYIDREQLGKIVFSDNKKLIKLNNIVHKYVVDELKKGIEVCKDKVIFLDIPLMFEQQKALNEMGLIYDEIWLIFVNEEIQKYRLTQRAKQDNKNIEETLKIIKKQIPLEEKKLLADKIINNEGTIQELQQEILELIKQIRI